MYEVKKRWTLNIWLYTGKIQQDGRTYIDWSDGTRTYLKQIKGFKNDGQWHLITEKITVPVGVTSGKIRIGNDIPNLYGEGSYIDIGGIQFTEGETVSPYYITQNTVVGENLNHTVFAKWIKD